MTKINVLLVISCNIQSFVIPSKQLKEDLYIDTSKNIFHGILHRCEFVGGGVEA